MGLSHAVITSDFNDAVSENLADIAMECDIIGTAFPAFHKGFKRWEKGLTLFDSYSAQSSNNGDYYDYTVEEVLTLFDRERRALVSIDIDFNDAFDNFAEQIDAIKLSGESVMNEAALLLELKNARDLHIDDQHDDLRLKYKLWACSVFALIDHACEMKEELERVTADDDSETYGNYFEKPARGSVLGREIEAHEVRRFQLDNLYTTMRQNAVALHAAIDSLDQGYKTLGERSMKALSSLIPA